MWEIDNAVQLFGFVCSLAAGALLGLLYDGFRAVRRVLRPSVLHLAVTDTLFALLAAFCCFCLQMSLTAGQIRLYIFLGLGIGFCAEWALVSHFITSLLCYILRAAVKGISAFSGVFWGAFDTLEQKTVLFTKKCANFFKKVAKSVKKLLKRG